MTNINLGPILHRLATIHPLWMRDGRRTDDNHDNSSTITQVRLAKNAHSNHLVFHKPIMKLFYHLYVPRASQKCVWRQCLVWCKDLSASDCHDSDSLSVNLASSLPAYKSVSQSVIRSICTSIKQQNSQKCGLRCYKQTTDLVKIQLKLDKKSKIQS